MIVNELFNGNDQVEELDPKIARSAYGLTDISALYLLPIKGQEYVFYFEQPVGGSYSFGFGKVEEKFGRQVVNHKLTGEGIPFQILPAVIQTIMMFIERYEPWTISFSGSEPRQEEFYARLLPYLKRKLPASYFTARQKYHNALGRFIISRDDEDTSFVTEDAHNDIVNLRRAEEITDNFLRWLSKANEDKPLRDVMWPYPFRNKGMSTLTASGEQMGLPKENHDLRIGFGWAKEGEAEEGAFMAPAFFPQQGGRIFFIILSIDHDPSNDIDLAFGVRRDYLVHELTHYLDRKRQKTVRRPNDNFGYIRGADTRNSEIYFNHPLEFNAYFTQGMHQILKDLPMRMSRLDGRDLSSFQEFTNNNLFNFDPSFRSSLNPEYKRRFARRLYKLFIFLKQNWPDINPVKAEEASR